MPDLPASFDPHRFRTAAAYYERYRLGYPDRLIRKVLELTRTNAGAAVLDLGCGPGTLSLPLARAGLRVTAVDPEPEMLSRAKAAADEGGLEIDFRQGSSFDLPENIGPFQLVTMGRAFHWMDRAATLALLDALVLQDGAVAHFDDEHMQTGENAWRKVLRDLGNRYGRENAPHIREAASPQHRNHTSILLESPFNQLEHYGVFVRRQITADDIVGYAFSLSTTALQQLQDRRDDFERELRAALAELSPAGRFAEIAELSALIAHRG